MTFTSRRDYMLPNITKIKADVDSFFEGHFPLA